MDMLAMKPENVPEPVWRAAMSAYHKTLRKNPDVAWQTAIVAALNAWPGMEMDRVLGVKADTAIILPLTQEPPHDQR